MTSFIKGLALFVLIAAVTILAVSVQWESSQRDVDTADIVLYMVVLPLLLFVLALLARSAWRAHQRRAAAAAAAAAGVAAAGGAQAGAPAVPSREAQERHLTRQIVDMQLRVSAGASVSEVVAALAEGKSRPGPDAELVDDDGLPVISARIDDLEVDAFQDAAQDALASARAQQEAWHTLEPTTACWRALAALAEPLDAALSGLTHWAGPLGLAEPEAQQPSRTVRREEAVLPMLHLIIGLGPTHAELDVALAQAWVRWRCTEAGLPMARVSVQAFAGAAPVLWQRVDAAWLALHREARRDLLIVAAAHSDLDEHTVNAYASGRRLFKAGRQPRGLMPGEGAGVLTLAPPDWPAAADGDPPAPHLHRAGQAMREKSVEEAGRIGCAELQRAAADALAAARLAGGALGACVADADQHTARAGEWFAAVLATAPDLDAAQDVQVLGAALGHLGAVGSLAAVMVAADRARRDDKPVLAAAVADPLGRLAWVLRARADEAAASAAAAPAAATAGA